MPAPQLSAKFHLRNRRNLLSAMEDNSAAVLFAAPMRLRNGDVHFPYRQDSHFAYLTGFPEANAAAVFLRQGSDRHYALYCQERNPERELWDGEIIGHERAASEYGTDAVYHINDFPKHVAELVQGCDKVYLSSRDEQDLNVGLSERLAHLDKPPERMSIDFILDEMRLIKSGDELKLMRQAARITRQGFERVMAELRPGMNECEVEATLMAAYRGQGATWAYPNIVAGAERALVLHYTRNDQELREGDLLLIDSGAEYLNYASDVSRTLPVSGRYTEAQRRVYDIVLEAQRAAIDCVQPGRSWPEPHHRAVRVLVEGLRSLGIVQGSVDDCIESGAVRRYYPHRTSHWLGMDVHDVGDYRIEHSWRELEAGMVFTIEPGIYLPIAEDVPEAYRGIGIRTEDDVLVRSQDKAQILTADIPVSAEDIEHAMKHSRKALAKTA